MEREIDLKEISDGRLYRAGDMVKIGCNDCAGCSGCCHDMGVSIVLDPYDAAQLERALSAEFSELLGNQLELNVVDGVILPNLKMQQTGNACGFLNEEGRCGIHAYRPGFCRMFPLGRIYGEDDFQYFLQLHECPYPGKTKVKIKKWLGIPELSGYEQFVKDWHFFLKEVQAAIKETENEEIAKKLNLYILNAFFFKNYPAQTHAFYEEFYRRLAEGRKALKMYQ